METHPPPQWLIDALQLPHEIEGVEFKCSMQFASGRPECMKVVKAVLAMANRRGGGRVVVGVREGDGGVPVPEGVSDEHLENWTHNAVGGSAGSFGSPAPRLRIQRLPYNGITLVVIEVDEFALQPVVCTKSFPGVLDAGACYVRRRSPVASDKATFQEMHDLLELATEKRLQHFVGMVHRAGLSLQPTSAKDESSAQLYERERGDFR